MLRLSYMLLSLVTLVGLSIISDNFGDMNFTFETWLGSFILPIWSLLSIGFWYDTGRFLFTKAFNFDNKNSIIPVGIRSIVFILWMSVVFTCIVWLHISLYALPLLLVIPILAIPFKDIIIQDWNVKPVFTYTQAFSILIWLSISYGVYWLLTLCWMMIRIWIFNVIDNDFIYYTL